MENNLEAEIKESIRKNLPEQVGSVLTEQLNKLKTLEAEHLTRIADIEQRNKTIEDLRRRIYALEDVVRKAGDLDKRETEIKEREIFTAVRDLKTQLAAEERISSSYFQFMSGLVKNTVFKESVYKNISTGVDFNNGANVHYPIGETINTTKEAD